MQQVVRKKIAESHNICTEPTIYTLILDMNNIMKISMVDNRLSSLGKSYGMVYQTLLAIRNQLQKKAFNFVYAMYDGNNSGQLRYNIYKDYKSNRDKSFKDSNKSDYDKSIDDYCKKVIAYHKAKGKPERKLSGETDDESFERQRGIIFDILDELFIRQVMCDDVEGDDLIASYVMNKKPNEKIVIVSGDRDLTQLIADDVCVYIPQLKKYIIPSNHISEIGYTHENVMLKKVFCGDSSDAIKGIKGMGDTTFFKLFPEAKERAMTIEDIVNKAMTISEERKRGKKKPLQVIENVIGRVTEGCQGDRIYEINEEIINLRKPMLTEEASEMLNMVSYAPLSPEGRDYGNVYRIITENGMTDMIPTDKFTSLFAPFNALIEMEKKYFEKSGC